MTGEELYRLWCGDPQGRTDRARYFTMMNPADKQAWDELAALWTRDKLRAEVLHEVLTGVRQGLEKVLGDSPKVQSLMGSLDRVLGL